TAFARAAVTVLALRWLLQYQGSHPSGSAPLLPDIREISQEYPSRSLGEEIARDIFFVPRSRDVYYLYPSYSLVEAVYAVAEGRFVPADDDLAQLPQEWGGVLLLRTADELMRVCEKGKEWLGEDALIRMRENSTAWLEASIRSGGGA